MKTEVTHDNFDRLTDSVKSGDGIFLIPTYTRCTEINARCFARFAKLNLSPIWKSTDGNGFRMASGRNSVYVMPGYLLYVK